MTKTVSFTQMKDGSREDYLLLHELEKPFVAMTAERILRELSHQADDTMAAYFASTPPRPRRTDIFPSRAARPRCFSRGTRAKRSTHLPKRS